MREEGDGTGKMSNMKQLKSEGNKKYEVEKGEERKERRGVVRRKEITSYSHLDSGSQTTQIPVAH